MRLFAKIYEPAIIELVSATPSEWAVYSFVALMSDFKTGICECSQTTISQDLGLDKRTVRRAEALLVKRGLLKTEKNGRERRLTVIDIGQSCPHSSNSIEGEPALNATDKNDHNRGRVDPQSAQLRAGSPSIAKIEGEPALNQSPIEGEPALNQSPIEGTNGHNRGQVDPQLSLYRSERSDKKREISLSPRARARACAMNADRSPELQMVLDAWSEIVEPTTHTKVTQASVDLSAENVIVMTLQRYGDDAKTTVERVLRAYVTARRLWQENGVGFLGLWTKRSSKPSYFDQLGAGECNGSWWRMGDQIDQGSEEPWAEMKRRNNTHGAIWGYLPDEAPETLKTTYRLDWWDAYQRGDVDERGFAKDIPWI